MNVPVIVVGWTSQRKRYVPAGSAGTLYSVAASPVTMHPGLSASLDVFKRGLARTRLADVTPSGLASA